MRDLLKRTPFRLAAAFSLFFITTVLALFTVIYLVASARLVSDIRDRVRTNLVGFADACWFEVNTTCMPRRCSLVSKVLMLFR